MKLQVDARLLTTEGRPAGGGVGRWRMYFDAEDMDDAAFAARHLVPKCQVRIREGRRVIFGPCLAEELTARRKY